MMTRKSVTMASSGSAASNGNALLDNQPFESHSDTEVFPMITVELVVIGILEPFARRFVVDEKSEYDEICAASGPLCNFRRRTVPWRRQNLWVGIDVDTEFRHVMAETMINELKSDHLSLLRFSSERLFVGIVESAIL
jgi:hypothetical protein